MKYRAIIDFIDLQDGNRLYHAGENFPREGAEVTAERLEELATSKNRMGHPLIEAVKQADEAKKPSRKRASKDA